MVSVRSWTKDNYTLETMIMNNSRCIYIKEFIDTDLVEMKLQTISRILVCLLNKGNTNQNCELFPCPLEAFHKLANTVHSVFGESNSKDFV